MFSFSLEARDLSVVNSNGDRVVAAGSYRVSVGGGQPGTGASQADAAFAIRGKQRLPENEAIIMSRSCRCLGRSSFVAMLL